MGNQKQRDTNNKRKFEKKKFYWGNFSRFYDGKLFYAVAGKEEKIWKMIKWNKRLKCPDHYHYDRMGSQIEIEKL